MDGAVIPSRHSRGFFARWLARIETGQLRQARAVARPHLLRLGDDELARLGYRRDEIRRWESLSHWI
jgi:hypothetical protein